MSLGKGQRVAHDAAQTLALRLADRSDLFELFIAETGYAADDAKALWSASFKFLEDLQTLEALRCTLLEAETRALERQKARAAVKDRPWGRVLVCLPANAPAPLAIVVPFALLAAGNAVIVAASAHTRTVAVELASLVQQLAPDRVLIWGGSVRVASSALLKARLVDAVYYMGSSAHYSQLAAECAQAGVHLLFEGEGNGVAILDESLDPAEVASAASCLLAAKTSFHGRMCSAPNVVLVSRKIASDFRREYAQAARVARHLPPLREVTASSTLLYIEQLVAKGATASAGPEAATLLLEGVPLEEALSRELFCPALVMVEFDDWQSMLTQLEPVRHRLQASLFSKSSSRLDELVERTHFARYMLNRRPTDQDPSLPWGNYGASGHSDVKNYLAKGFRRVLIEH
jgi:acyl-CoA reductase-like NAD-dependent aldehyde dehydrogenase